MKEKKILLPSDPSGVRSPWFWIGTWSMGGEGFGKGDLRESLDVINAAIEAGISHFDTAGFYAHGRSEELLARAVGKKRGSIFVSTKGGLVWEGRRVEHRGSPSELEEQLHASLKRLRTDYIDLFQLHWPDPEIPVGESIDALKSFKQSGMIRYWGVGNLTEAQVDSFLRADKDIPHQVHYNPVHRSDDVLNAGKERCINCITSPLEQGLLGAGKSSKGKNGIGKSDVRNRNPRFGEANVIKWSQELQRLAGASKVVSVLAWICSRPYVNAVISGPRKKDQLDELASFLKFVEKEDLISSAKGISVLSETKTKDKVRPEIWEHLSEGPQ
ncbi:MAG: aldo/keto reductase [Nitrospirota bacterium]|nr:MAG: aldo/keto reductase [Nitrospirota bacterium]